MKPHQKKINMKPHQNIQMYSNDSVQDPDILHTLEKS